MTQDRVPLVLFDRSALHGASMRQGYQRLIAKNRMRVLLPDILLEEPLRVLTKTPSDPEPLREAVSNLLSLSPYPLKPISQIIIHELATGQTPCFSILEKRTVRIREIESILREENPDPTLLAKAMNDHEVHVTNKEKLQATRLRIRAETKPRLEKMGKDYNAGLQELRAEPGLFEAYWRNNGIEFSRLLLEEKLLPAEGLQDWQSMALTRKWAEAHWLFPATTAAMRAWSQLAFSSHHAQKKHIRANDQDDCKYLQYAQFADLFVTADRTQSDASRLLYPRIPRLLTPQGLLELLGKC